MPKAKTAKTSHKIKFQEITKSEANVSANRQRLAEAIYNLRYNIAYILDKYTEPSFQDVFKTEDREQIQAMWTQLGEIYKKYTQGP